jgi:2-polyprenyl-6-methoxyphenol hydroxylase-like FAD-dependent oxidoreductase
VGGSCTGVFAAVRAARLGLSVALIEQNIILGGSATAAQVNEWHSIRDARQEKQIIGGLTMEVVERLRRRGSLAEITPVHRGQFRFNSAELALELDALIREHRIRLFLGARLASATHEGDRINAAVIEDKSGRRALFASVFIDASGDGDLLRRAGFAAWKPEVLQPVNMQTLVAGFSNLHAHYPEARFWDSIRHLAADHGFPAANASPWVFDYPGPRDLNNVFGPRSTAWMHLMPINSPPPCSKVADCNAPTPTWPAKSSRKLRSTSQPCPMRSVCARPGTPTASTDSRAKNFSAEPNSRTPSPMAPIQ